MLTGIVLAVAGIFIAVVVMSGEVFSRAYLAPWNPNYHKQFHDPRMQLVAHGILAANGHNMQPWRIKLDNAPMSFLLYADETRLTPEVDPEARQTMITQGTFLEYVRLAGEKLGYAVNIDLFPEGEPDSTGAPASIKSHPVARITLAASQPRQNACYSQLFNPDTARVPYGDAQLTQDELQKLRGIQDTDSVTLRIVTDENDCARLKQFSWTGAQVESGIDAINKANERLFRANAWQKNRYRYGFSMEGQAISGVKLNVLQALLTLMPSLNNPKAAGDMFLKQTKEALDHTPAYALILTKDNSRTSQVRAGMLYSRLQLTCGTLGLAVQPLSQSQEEYAEMQPTRQALHKAFAPNDQTIQMLVRLGRPTQSVPRSMRRDASDLY